MLFSSYFCGRRAAKERSVVQTDVCKVLDGNVIQDYVIGEFAFPEASLESARRQLSASAKLKHLFVMPGSSRMYGFARRLFRHGENGGGGAFWEWSVLLSESCFIGLFYVLLDHLAAMDQAVRIRYLELLFVAEVPRPGRSYPPIDGSSLVLRMPNSRYLMGEVNCKPLFESLPVELIAKLFCTLLLERKFVFVSQSTERVVACTHAIISLLYPFSFEHLFLLLLPASMLDYTTAPFPFVFGTTVSVARIQTLPVDQINYIDLDAHDASVSREDLELLPTREVQRLIASLHKSRSRNAFGTAQWNMSVQDAFLDFFVNLISTFSVYLSPSSGFDSEAFLADSNYPEFMARFLESQMWNSFIDSRKEKPLKDEFERRCLHAMQQPSPRPPVSGLTGLSAMFQSFGNSFRNDSSSEMSSANVSVATPPPPVPARTYQRKAEVPVRDLLSFDAISNSPAPVESMISFDLIPDIASPVFVATGSREDEAKAADGNLLDFDSPAPAVAPKQDLLLIDLNAFPPMPAPEQPVDPETEFQIPILANRLIQFDDLVAPENKSKES